MIVTRQIEASISWNSRYRMSSYSFRGNYSFLKLALCTVTFGDSTWKCGNYSRLETIRGNRVFNKMWFQEVYVMKKKISNFLKTPVFSITLTFINDYVFNVDDIKEFWSFGLCWSLLAFIAFLAFATLDESFKQKVAFLAKIKHNWPVCINQMLKPISRWHQAF